MRNVYKRNLPQEVIIPRVDAANGRVVDGISGFPVPPQYMTRGPVGTDETGRIIYGPLDSRFPQHLDRIVPDIFGISFSIFTGSNGEYDEDD